MLSCNCLNHYLQEHGITYHSGYHAGLKSVNSAIAEAMKLFPTKGFIADTKNCDNNCIGVVFPYLHPLSSEPHRSLVRIRYYAPDESLRFSQPKGSGVEAFFDANIDWKAVFADQKIGIRFVEGEAKAIALNQHWRTLDRTVTVALGGVHNFRTSGGKDLTPWLRMVRAASQNGRKLIVTFDDDAEANIQIQKAEAQLMKLLAVQA